MFAKQIRKELRRFTCRSRKTRRGITKKIKKIPKEIFPGKRVNTNITNVVVLVSAHLEGLYATLLAESETV